MSSNAISDSSSGSLQQLLLDAKGGNTDSLGRLLESYQNYLKLLAHSQLDAQVRGRVNPSDVVQETMLEAHCDFPKFRGTSDGEFFMWLRKILANNLARIVERHVLAAKRDVRREVSHIRVDASLDRSALRLEAMLTDQQPNVDSQASLQEQLVLLADSLARLSPDYRDVIVLRHLEGIPFAQIAARLRRSSGATRMLWLRAIEQLRRLMKEKSQS